MKIRKAKLSDVKRIYYLLNNVEELRDFENGEEYPITWVRDVISSKRDNIVLVAYESEEIIGFLIAHLMVGVKDCILNNIYVNPSHRKKGIATKLLKVYEFEAKKKGMKFSAAMSKVDNKKIQAFNEKNTYKKGERFYYYYKLLR